MLTADLLLLILDAARFDNQFLFTKFEIQSSPGVLSLKHFETIPKDKSTENWLSKATLMKRLMFRESLY